MEEDKNSSGPRINDGNFKLEIWPSRIRVKNPCSKFRMKFVGHSANGVGSLHFGNVRTDAFGIERGEGLLPFYPRGRKEIMAGGSMVRRV